MTRKIIKASERGPGNLIPRPGSDDQELKL